MQALPCRPPTRSCHRPLAWKAWGDLGVSRSGCGVSGLGKCSVGRVVKLGEGGLGRGFTRAVVGRPAAFFFRRLLQISN